MSAEASLIIEDPRTPYPAMDFSKRRLHGQHQVTASRIADDEEYFAMSRFAEHASHCVRCVDPIKAHFENDGLCNVGNENAHVVMQYVYSRNGKPFSVIDREHKGDKVELEIPRKFTVIKNLCKAVEQGLVLEQNTDQVTDHTLSPIQYERLLRRRAQRTTVPLDFFKKRGSLYEKDMIERHEYEPRFFNANIQHRAPLVRDPWIGYGSLIGHPAGTIRLLELKPGKWDENIKAFLRPALVRARYSAVSYVWGSDEASREVLLNSRSFFVRQNLFDCLRHIRDERFSRLLWIDAICVNQEDLDERASQVRLMGQIYGQATEVLVWLGVDQPISPGSDTALSSELPFVIDEQRIAKLFRSEPETSMGTLSLKENMRNACGITIARLQEITELCQRNYWSRMWILQEMILGQTIVVHHGRISEAWDDFIGDCRTISNLSKSFHAGIPVVIDVQESVSLNCLESPERISIRRAYPQMSSISREKWDICCKTISTSGIMNIQMHREQRRQPSLFSLFLHYRDRNCSDPRDKIYSLLSMAEAPSATGMTDSLEVSYSISLADLFLRVIKVYGIADEGHFSGLQKCWKLSQEDILAAHFSKSRGPRHDSLLVPFRIYEAARVVSVLYSTMFASTTWSGRSQCAHLLLLKPSDPERTPFHSRKRQRITFHLALLFCDELSCRKSMVDQPVVYVEDRILTLYSSNSVSPGEYAKVGMVYPLSKPHAWQSFLYTKTFGQDLDVIIPNEIVLLPAHPDGKWLSVGKAWFSLQRIMQGMERAGDLRGAVNEWKAREARYQLPAHLYYIYQQMYENTTRNLAVEISA